MLGISSTRGIAGLMTDIHTPFVTRAYELALKSYTEGGCPIGSVLVRGGVVIGEGHNQRIQQGDPIAHGEMDALRNAGRQTHYRDTILYTSLSPCMMCAGTIVQFGIPHVVIAENSNFGGNEAFLRERGVLVEVVDDARCVELMARFIAERPALWNEDIAEG
jgi:cytosine deaminase